jgi:probable HAF family extracellular repeat protein
MRKSMSSLIASLSLCAALALPVVSFAQEQKEQKEEKKEHHHYKLIDLGTLGGPSSLSIEPFTLDVSSRGVAIAQADTSIPDPYSPNCLTDCLVNHAITWHNGVQTDLGALPGGNNSSIPFWVNDVGTVVGVSENGVIDPLTGFPEISAVLWKDGKIFDLGTLGGNASLANAINNRGQVVGVALNTILDSDVNGFSAHIFSVIPFPVATQARAFLWQHGVMHDLGTLGTGNDALALFLNNRSQVAGASFTNTIPNATTGIPTLDPFFWENGKMLDVGTLGGTAGVPFGMNNRGQVVGDSFLAGDQNIHAFLWDKEEGLKDLGTLPGGSFSGANGINDAGEIVGGSLSSNGHHAVLWKNRAMIDLGTLAGDCKSDALSINSQGQIVGNSSPDCVQDGNAVLFEDSGAPINLNTLVPPGSGLTVVFAFDINDRGEIAAHALTPVGDLRAVLLIPCDENHADEEGCDFDTVDAETAAQVRPAQTPPPSAAAGFAKLSPAEMMKRRHHQFGSPQFSPK